MLAQVKTVCGLSHTAFLKVHLSQCIVTKYALHCTPRNFLGSLLRSQKGTELCVVFPFMKTAQTLQLPPSHAIRATYQINASTATEVR